LIICDAWYGFPTQKRPRKERILAVARQLRNFASWNHQYRTRQQSFRDRQHSPSNTGYDDSIARILVIGRGEDVKAIKERMTEINTVEKISSLSLSERSSNRDETLTYDNDSEYIFLPETSLEQLCAQLGTHSKYKTDVHILDESSSTGAEVRMNSNDHHLQQHEQQQQQQQNMVVYLSPDATERLNPSLLPPYIVVIGMLVDRRVQPNRSKTRGESIQTSLGWRGEDTLTSTDRTTSNNNSSRLEVLRLPLDQLKVSDLDNYEALNIDTVLEIMQRWWYNSAQEISKSRGDTHHSCQRINQDRANAFVDATTRALLTHRERHPNRITHGGSNSKISTGTISKSQS